MTLTQMRYFCTAARYRSITQAARTLYVTQPAISIAIRELEKEFSINLFQHSGGQLTLTEEGEIIYQKVSAILSSCDDLKEEYSGKDNIRSLVRLGIPPLLSTIFFPKLLDAFHSVHPDIWLELQEFGSMRCCALVQDEVLDIGLVNMELANIEKFHTMEIMNDPLVFCVSKDHPFSDRPLIDLKDLDKEPVILFNRDSVNNQVLQGKFDSLGITPRIVMHSSQITTILNFLRKGNCGCFFYRSMLPQFPEIVGIPLKQQTNTRVGLIWKRGRYLNLGMKAFIDFCKAFYNEPVSF